MLKKSTLLLILLVLLTGCAGVINSEQAKLNDSCKEFSKKYIAEQEEKFDWVDYSFTDTDAFWSPKLETCVQTERAQLENNFNLYDIKQNFMKDLKVIFHCDNDGVDNAIIEKVRANNGYVMNVPYSEWLDNMEGEKPRTLKTPPEPYTKDRCEKLFSKKINEIK